MVGPSLNTHNPSIKPIKFFCSYGGRIVPRYPDGKLRYQGGETRVLSVDRSVSFLELFVKMVEICGTAVSLKCQLPSEDLDALVSITSDEDLTHLIEEYDRAAVMAAAETSLKIRAFLFGPKPTKRASPPPSSASSSTGTSSPRSIESVAIPPLRRTTSAGGSSFRQVSRPPAYPVFNDKSSGKRVHVCGHVGLIHNGNDWQ